MPSFQVQIHANASHATFAATRICHHMHFTPYISETLRKHNRGGQLKHEMPRMCIYDNLCPVITATIFADADDDVKNASLAQTTQLAQLNNIRLFCFLSTAITKSYSRPVLSHLARIVSIFARWGGIICMINEQLYRYLPAWEAQLVWSINNCIDICSRRRHHLRDKWTIVSIFARLGDIICVINEQLYRYLPVW